MAELQFGWVVQGITVLGGAIALLLAVFQIVDTYLDIKEKLRKERARRKRGKGTKT